jgi:D-alanyl-D-alanine carboxypeptidase
MRLGRLATNAGAAVVGAIVGAVVVLAAQGATQETMRRSAPTEEADKALDVKRPERLAPARTILLAWSPGGIPAGTEAALEKLPVVTDATTIRAGLEWIEGSRTSDGAVLDDPPKGQAIPFEVAIVEPHEYASYVVPSEREAILALQPGQAVLAQTESEIRGAGAGLKIDSQGGPLLVTDVVSDATTQGYEALLAGPIPDTWMRSDRFVLMHVTNRSAQAKVARLIRQRLEPGRVLRIRAQGETPFLRYGDAVLPQLVVKANFGEFSAQPNTDGTVMTGSVWRRKNITRRSLPILGDVTCHRSLFPQLEQALQQVEDAGLAFTIDPGDFGGCFSSRFIDSNPGGRLSHHSWGIAVDFNVAQNRPGTKADIDRRFVRIMESNGFTWGGRWLIPDGMHFEWVRFP